MRNIFSYIKGNQDSRIERDRDTDRQTYRQREKKMMMMMTIVSIIIRNDFEGLIDNYRCIISLAGSHWSVMLTKNRYQLPMASEINSYNGTTRKKKKVIDKQKINLLIKPKPWNILMQQHLNSSWNTSVCWPVCLSVCLSLSLSLSLSPSLSLSLSLWMYIYIYIYKSTNVNIRDPNSNFGRGCLPFP